MAKREFQSNLIGRPARIADTDDKRFIHWGYPEGSPLGVANAKGTGEIVTAFMGEDSPTIGVLFKDGTIIEMSSTTWLIGEKLE